MSVKPRHSLFVAGCLILVLVGCARKPLTPSAPWTDIVSDSLSFLAATTDPDGLSLEYTFDWGDGQTSTTPRYHSGDTACLRHVFADAETHKVRVQARNESGRSSAWSAPLFFRSSAAPTVIDTIVGPVRWAVNRWYRASVKVTDPDGDSVSVKFVWGDVPDRTWTAFAPSGSVITDSCQWTATGPHAVRVEIKDQGGMMARPDVVKTVSVSPVAVLWLNDEVEPGASPTLGLAGGQVVVCAVDEHGVWAINADGTTRWKWERDPMSAHNSPSTSADGSRLYVADDNRGVICFDVATGTVCWQLAEQYGDCTPVVGPGGVVYVVSQGAVTRIRDLGDTAAVEWTANGFHENTNVVLGANGAIYGISYGSWNSSAAMVFAMDSGGVLLWQDTSHVTDDYGGLMSCPALDGRGRLLVVSGYDSLICFNPDGSVAWSAGVAGLYSGGITVGYDDRIYVQSCDEGYVYCLDSDGCMAWVGVPPDGAGYLNNVCALADSSILIVCYGEYVGCLDWSGQVLWDFWVGDSLDIGRRSADEGDEGPTPIVGPDGNVYLVYYDGICCLAADNACLAPTSWPTYNHDNARSGWAGRPRR